MVSGFGRDLTWGSSYRACRDPGCNHRRVFHQLYFENVCWITIIKQLSVNGSVQFLGLSDQAWGSGLPYIANLLPQVDATGWVSSNSSNQIWGGCFKGANIIINDSLGASIDSSTDNLTRIHGRPHAAQRRSHDDFLLHRRQEHLWRQFSRRNARVLRQGQDRCGPIIQ